MVSTNHHHLKSFSLLLVEDDEDDLCFFREALMEISPGVTFHHSRNGLEAIKFLSLLKPEKPHIIFTDLNMPIMSGLEFLKQMKKYEALKDVPIFVLSTANDMDTRQKALELGATDFFAKPPTVEELKNIVMKAFRILEESFISNKLI